MRKPDRVQLYNRKRTKKKNSNNLVEFIRTNSTEFQNITQHTHSLLHITRVWIIFLLISFFSVHHANIPYFWDHESVWSSLVKLFAEKREFKHALQQLLQYYWSSSLVLLLLFFFLCIKHLALSSHHFYTLHFLLWFLFSAFTTDILTTIIYVSILINFICYSCCMIQQIDCCCLFVSHILLKVVYRSDDNGNIWWICVSIFSHLISSTNQIEYPLYSMLCYVMYNAQYIA